MSGTWQKGRKKLNNADAVAIRRDFFSGGNLSLRITQRYARLAHEYGVHPRTIERVIKGHTHNGTSDTIKPDRRYKPSAVDLAEEL